MSLPTNTQIDAAVPVAGTPSRTLVNQALKDMAAIPALSVISFTANTTTGSAVLAHFANA